MRARKSAAISPSLFDIGPAALYEMLGQAAAIAFECVWICAAGRIGEICVDQPEQSSDRKSVV